LVGVRPPPGRADSPVVLVPDQGRPVEGWACANWSSPSRPARPPRSPDGTCEPITNSFFGTPQPGSRSCAHPGYFFGDHDRWRHGFCRQKEGRRGTPPEPPTIDREGIDVEIRHVTPAKKTLDPRSADQIRLVAASSSRCGIPRLTFFGKNAAPTAGIQVMLSEKMGARRSLEKAAFF